MDSALILIIVLVAVLLVLALTAGLVLTRRRRISLAERAEPAAGPDAAAGEPPGRDGGYQAGGAISFSAGTDTVERPSAQPVEPPPAETPPAGRAPRRPRPRRRSNPRRLSRPAG